MSLQNFEQSLLLFLNRSSVRKFTAQKIEKDIFDSIIQAGLQAPTSSHIQAFAVINIIDPTIRKQIYELTGQQQWILDASHFLVLCADLHKLTYFNHDLQIEKFSQDAYLASLLDGALVGMTVSLAAEALNIGSVMIGSVRNDVEQISSLLNLPKGVMPLFGLCLGYYEKRKTPKPRLSKDLFVFENKYEIPQTSDELLNEYHKLLNQYYADNKLEHAGLRAQIDKTWLQVVSASVLNSKRMNMGADLKRRGFDLSANRVE